MAAAQPTGPGNSRDRLRGAVLARIGALIAAIGEPATFHVIGACLAVILKVPLDARVEPLSVWTSAVLRIGWDLMGSEDVAAPTHIWSCSEPNMVVTSAVCIVMNWVGRQRQL